MEHVFAYGTLQDPNVQNALFKRTLSGVPDTLRGFALSRKKVYDSYPVVSKMDDRNAFVEGTVYPMEERELAIADVYEGPGYARKRVTLESGRTAWVYLEREG